MKYSPPFEYVCVSSLQQWKRSPDFELACRRWWSAEIELPRSGFRRCACAFNSPSGRSCSSNSCSWNRNLWLDILKKRSNFFCVISLVQLCHHYVECRIWVSWNGLAKWRAVHVPFFEGASLKNCTEQYFDYLQIMYFSDHHHVPGSSATADFCLHRQSGVWRGDRVSACRFQVRDNF